LPRRVSQARRLKGPPPPPARALRARRRRLYLAAAADGAKMTRDQIAEAVGAGVEANAIRSTLPEDAPLWPVPDQRRPWQRQLAR
jgi:hypothetical protein